MCYQDGEMIDVDENTFLDGDKQRSTRLIIFLSCWANVEPDNMDIPTRQIRTPQN